MVYRMTNRLILMVLAIVTWSAVAQSDSAYGDGEYCKYRIHYGFVTAGYATMKVKSKMMGQTPIFHIIGEGRTTGLSNWFFRVEDDYQTYVDQSTQLPLLFKRKIDEGGFTKDVQINFNHQDLKAVILNKENNVKVTAEITPLTQDLVSAFYYLRNELDISTIKVGETVDLDMFFDKEGYRFQMKFLGRSALKTKFGVVKTLKFRPLVEGGRVFKAKESLTVWVTDDDNKIPVLIKADLAVGSLKASLYDFKGLKHPFKVLSQ